MTNPHIHRSEKYSDYLRFKDVKIGESFIFRYELKEFNSRRFFIDHVMVMKKINNQEYERRVPVKILMDKRKRVKYIKVNGITIQNTEVCIIRNNDEIIEDILGRTIKNSR